MNIHIKVVACEQADAAHIDNMKKHLRQEAELYVGEGMVDRIEVNPIPTLTADDKLVEAAEAVRQALISGDILEELEVAYPDFAELVKEVAEVASMAPTQHGMVDRIEVNPVPATTTTTDEVDYIENKGPDIVQHVTCEVDAHDDGARWALCWVLLPESTT